MISEKESGFSKQAEATLIKQAQAGSQESLNLLLLRHEQLVHWVVQRQWLCTLPYVIAVQTSAGVPRHFQESGSHSAKNTPQKTRDRRSGRRIRRLVVLFANFRACRYLAGSVRGWAAVPNTK
jgi:hypothetical protein